jgi:ribosomal protein L27
MKFYKTTKNRVNTENNWSNKEIYAINLSAMLILILFLIATPTVAQFAGGSGTAEDPYQIETIEQLQDVGQEEYRGSHFLLIADIDASETAGWNDGKGFEPLRFDGHFDGDGHVITGLTIAREQENEVGLFGFTFPNAVIKNLGLEDINVIGRNNVGGLVGRNYESVIQSCYAAGQVSGDWMVGGLIGALHSDRNPERYWMISSYADVRVTGTNEVGGLIGGMSLIFPLSSMMRSVNQSFAVGEVTGEETVGGLMGYPKLAIIHDSYWDFEATGQIEGVSDSTGTGFIGLTTDQMTGQNAYIHMYKLDFKDTWQLTEGYPRLRWQEPEDAVDPPSVPIVRIDTTKRDFGMVVTDSSGTVEVIIRNTGNKMLNGEAFLVGSDTGAFAIADGLSSFSLEADSSQTVAITFHPESPDRYEAELHVVHDAPNRSDTLIISLVGEGKSSTFAMPDPDRPQRVELQQNYPNPFNPSTVIAYQIPEESHVRLSIYDVTGRQVSKLVDEVQPHGEYRVTWDALNMASGVYISRLTVGEVIINRPMTLIK